jgi:tRNA(Ile2) C34 agmatinyltransferase TiaS
MTDEMLLENPNCDHCGFRLMATFETQSFRCSNCDTDTPWSDTPDHPADTTPSQCEPPPPVGDS